MLTVQSFLRHWKTLPLKKHESRILLAVSGGVDSMVMVQLFLAADIPVAIAHCNFGLRGGESDADEALVKAFAEANRVPFHLAKFDTAGMSASGKTGIQETARKLRYDWLLALLEEQQYRFCCTAHHSDDVAETVLMNLARGTGIAGLHGIRAVQKNLVRPLLPFSKKDISGFAETHQIPYREDASNSTNDYTRNAIRNKVLPALEEIIPGAAKRIADGAGRIEEAEILYRRSIDAESKKLLEKRGNDFYIPVRLLKQRRPLTTIFFELLQPFGFNAAQAAEAQKLLTAESGRQVHSGTHTALRNRDFIIITSRENAAADIILIPDFPAVVQTAEAQFRLEVISRPHTISEDAGICLIDADEIAHPLLLRRWKQGDYFYPLGMGRKKKKVSRFLIDQKTPLHQKQNIWILESAGRIVWVCGKRSDERFRLKPATDKVLKVTMQPR